MPLFDTESPWFQYGRALANKVADVAASRYDPGIGASGGHGALTAPPPVELPAYQPPEYSSSAVQQPWTPAPEPPPIFAETPNVYQPVQAESYASPVWDAGPSALAPTFEPLNPTPQMPQLGGGLGWLTRPVGGGLGAFLGGAQDVIGEGFRRAGETTAGMGTSVAPGLQDVGPSAEQVRPVGDVGQFVGESLVPRSPLELGLTVIPAALGTASAVSRGVPLGRAAVSNIAQQLAPLPGNFMQPELANTIPAGAVSQTVAPPALLRTEGSNVPRLVSPTEGEGLAGIAGAARRKPSRVPAPQIPPSSAATAVADVPPVEGAFAGNIRLDKYPEDIRGPISEWASTHTDEVQAARRGVRSDEQVLEDARSLVNDLGGDFDKLQRRWKPGDAWNAEEITALRGTLNDSTRAVIDAAETARTSGSIESHMQLAEAIMQQQRVQQTVQGVTAEAGRALRAFRQQSAEALASNDVRRMQEILRAAIGRNDQADIAQLADMIRGLDVNDPAAVSKFIRSVNKPGFWDYVTEYWYNSVLSGPWTHLRNAIGNTAAVMSEPVRRGASAGLESVVAPLQGRAPERFWQEVPESIAGAIHGIPEGVRGFVETLKTGISPQAASKIELARPRAIPGAAGRIIGIPSDMLQASDSFFHAINYRMSLWANATRSARMKGLTGADLQDEIARLVSDPTGNLIKQSSDDAERLLFRGDPGGFARSLTNLKNDYPALNMIIPFIRTPTNLLKFGVRNSPLGLLDAPMWRRVLAKNPQGVDELAQTLMGSGVAAGIGALVANGTIDLTAGVPSDPASRDRFYREGKLPFAVKMPGLGWVQYSQIPGLDTTFAFVAAVADGVRNGENVDQIAAQAGATIGQGLLDRSYMSGLSDFIDAVTDPARFAARYATRQLTSVVPFSSALRQTAQAIDPTVRAPEGLGEAFEANLPGLSKNVPPRLTAFGEEAKRGLPSPIQVKADTQSPVDAELESLGYDVGFVGDSIAGIGLSREQQQRYQILAGQTSQRVLAMLVESPQYQSLPPEQRLKAVESVVSRIRTEVREVVLRELATEAGVPTR